MSGINMLRMSMSDQNIARIRHVEQSFGSAGVPLLQTGRVLLAEGTLVKVCRKRPKKRQVFLFNDLLVYGASSQQPGSRQLVQQRVLPLAGLQTRLLTDGGGSAFQVMSPSKSFTLFAGSPDEAGKWVEFIRDCAAGQQGAAVDPSPVWVPDSSSAHCMLCMVEFSVLLCRRHHCRKCGILVCAGCSQGRWHLPAQSETPQRVCAECHRVLMAADAAAAAATS